MTIEQRKFTKEVVIFDDPRICVTSEHEDVGSVRSELLAVLGIEEFNRLCTHEHRIIFDAEYICRTSGGAIYHVIRTTIGDATHNDEKRHTYYAVAGGLPSTEVKLVLDLDHEASPEELGEVGGIMLEMPREDKIAPESEWREIFEKSTPEEWGGENFDDAQLEEVVLNRPDQPDYDENYGDWRPYGG